MLPWDVDDPRFSCCAAFIAFQLSNSSYCLHLMSSCRCTAVLCGCLGEEPSEHRLIPLRLCLCCIRAWGGS